MIITPTDFTRERDQAAYKIAMPMLRDMISRTTATEYCKEAFTACLTSSLVREMASELEMMVYAPDAQCFSEARVRGIEALERYNAVVKSLEK